MRLEDGEAGAPEGYAEPARLCGFPATTSKARREALTRGETRSRLQAPPSRNSSAASSFQDAAVGAGPAAGRTCVSPVGRVGLCGLSAFDPAFLGGVFVG